ncbi:hypothetical protein EYF80_020185 [Liparis tanakae]|uniref:Secreted protein n=1 Tax=Liparis tanakae TaxID=230148 RepID=A0A4Z2HV94_9TELE|nr:hypothetical protein EYF80_020185 [Liparis tanakae]
MQRRKGLALCWRLFSLQQRFMLIWTGVEEVHASVVLSCEPHPLHLVLVLQLWPRRIGLASSCHHVGHQGGNTGAGALGDHKLEGGSTTSFATSGAGVVGHCHYLSRAAVLGFVEKVEAGGSLGQVLLFGEGGARGGRRGVDPADDPLIALSSQHRAVDLEGAQGQLAGTRTFCWSSVSLEVLDHAHLEVLLRRGAQSLKHTKYTQQVRTVEDKRKDVRTGEDRESGSELVSGDEDLHVLKTGMVPQLRLKGQLVLRYCSTCTQVHYTIVLLHLYTGTLYLAQ